MSVIYSDGNWVRSFGSKFTPPEGWDGGPILRTSPLPPVPMTVRQLMDWLAQLPPDATVGFGEGVLYVEPPAKP